MSFQNNIDGGGRCTEKVCIQAKKVFDACLKQATMEDTAISLTHFAPPNYESPLQYVSCKSMSSTGQVKNLIVERLPDRPHFGRVQCDVLIPVEVTYVDKKGVDGKGTGDMVVHEDVILYLPDAAIIPYEVEATVSMVAPEGYYSGTAGDPKFTVVACVTIILKVTIPVELLIPTFGYAVIPPCQEFSQELCDSFFELPLFPKSNG